MTNIIDDKVSWPVGSSAPPVPGTGPDAAAAVSWSRRLQVWRSPDDQPPWARPALLAVMALAALAYSWQVGSSIEIFYAAAARSMSLSWHNFFYGAFDPAGVITVDKLPGALWVQALSVRLFGVNVWALILPQAVAGVLTVLVLYRAVRRLAGPVAGIAAAAVLAASPAVMVLDRGNIPDTWMILLFVLAADSTVSAIRTGRWRSMVMAGVWVALAFQAKMLEAWLVLPALGLAYLLAGRGDLRARIGRIVVLGAAALMVSLSYMTLVTLIPQSQRPYVDGSSNNSIYHQVFAYNGFGRVGQSPPNVVAEHTLRTPIFGNVESPASVDRLLRGGYGRDIGWLLPAAGVALVGILVARRRAPRTDLVRAGAVLWGTWLVVLGILLTFSTAINAYYSAALAPPIAALVAMGSVLAWEHRRRPVVALVAAGTVLVTMAYDAVTIPKAGTGLPSWLTGAAVVLGLAAAGVLGWSAWRQAARSGQGDRSGIGWVLAGATLLLVPIAACVSVVTETLGPFDTPFQSTAATAAIHQMFSAQMSPPGLATLEAARRGAPYLMAAQTSIVASTYIYATGQEVVPLGGYAGTAPSPSARVMRAMIAAGDFHTALIATPSASASASVIHDLCTLAGPPSSQTRFAWTQALKLYDCP